MTIPHYFDLADAGLLKSSDYGDDNVIENIERAFAKGLRKYPGKKFVIFHLDELDMLRAPRSEPHLDYTLKELHLVLRNCEVFRATYWIKDNYVLGPKKVKTLLEPVFQKFGYSSQACF